MSGDQNVFDPDTKKLLIRPSSAQQGGGYELGCRNWSKTLSNNVNDFARPVTQPGDTERRVQNLNQIEEIHTFRVLISDQFIATSSQYDSLGASTKEDVEEELDQLFKDINKVEVEYGHVSPSGYMIDYSVDEPAAADGSVFEIQFDLLVGIPMSS